MPNHVNPQQLKNTRNESVGQPPNFYISIEEIIILMWLASSIQRL